MTAATMASPMPGITPSSATPSRQPIDNQNSQRWMRQMRRRSAISIRPMAEAITTAARAATGRLRSRPGALSSMAPTANAPTTPVSCVLAPADSATGVRDALALIGKPWNKPAARLAAPRPTISWLGSTKDAVRAA